MAEGQERPFPLSPFRVLDLTDEQGSVCGKALGDLGADVIKIEPPGGDPARRLGPFYHDEPDPEKSLHWFAWNTSKRGITLNLETADGRALFQRLVHTADIVVESFPPEHLARLNLGYEDLTRIKPDIILTSITPFGQTGPYANYKGSDLVLQAMGGYAYLCGDEDRPPVRVGVPQVAAHAGLEAAAASLFALFHRLRTGEGQHVDLSMQLVAIWQLMNATPFPKLQGEDMKRQGQYARLGYIRRRSLYECKDGWVVGLFYGGRGISLVSTQALVRWMDEEGMASQELKEKDWASWDMAQMAQDPNAQEEIDRMEAAVMAFFRTKTKAEIFERAFRDRMLLAPANTIKDVVEHPQLQARGWWVPLDHPELGQTLSYPGPMGVFNNAAHRPRFRAPRIGEHNEEVYLKEMGLSQEELVTLQQVGAI